MNDRFPLGTILVAAMLVAVLVGAAYLAGEREGYALGRFDQSQNITLAEQ